MVGNTSTVQIEIQVDDKGGVKVLRQIGAESEKTGKKGSKGFRDMDRSAAGFNTQIKSMRRLLLSLGVGYAIVRIAREMIDLTDVASDLNETISKSRAIFGSSSAGIEAWAAKSATAIGLSTQVALEHAATIGNMYQQLGAGVDVAEQSSKSMVKLAADLASFHNVAGGASEVLLAMQSAFRGEYDALQRYIPTINAAAVQEQALAMTHKTTAKELTNLEKALAAQAIIMRDAGAAVGDFERTSGELANQKRILAAQIENVKAALGQGFLPIATQTIQRLNKWIEANETLLTQNIPLYIEGIVSALKMGLAPLKAWADLWKTLGWISGGGQGIMPGFEDSIEKQIQALEEKRAGIVKNYTGNYKDEYIANVDASIAALKEKAKEIDKSSMTKPISPPTVATPKTTAGTAPAPDTKALEDAIKLEEQLWEYEVKAAQRYDDEILDAHEDMIEYEKTLNGKAAKNKISMTEKMYADLKFSSADYYAYQLNQLQRQADDYETFTGNAELAHLWLTEQIKALDKERLEAAQKNNQFLIDLSERTSDALEDNFSRFYRDFFRGELDTAADYFRAFCNSLSDSFSDMLGQMTKEMLFGGGSSGGKGFFGSLFSGVGSFFGGGTSLDANAGLGADWAGTLWHEGGTVGKDPAPVRYVPAALFARAPRLHKGLMPDEFPAILQRGETVIPRGQSPSPSMTENTSNLTISVPFTIEGRGDERFASKLSYEIEDTVRRVMREEMR